MSDFFNDAEETQAKPETFRMVGVEGDEMTVALKMEKPSNANISKGTGKNHVIHYARKVMPFTYNGRKVTVRTMILVAKEK